MTLRRLNIEIQGYPESYAAEPLDMVGSEVGLYSPPTPSSHALPTQPSSTDGTATTARPPLDNATHVNFGGGGEPQHQGACSSSKNYDSEPLPPSPTNNKRLKTSSDVEC